MTNRDNYETYQQTKSSAAEVTAGRLADKARRLVEQSMASNAARKHKWATGKSKWDALQLEGAKAAGVVGTGRGRPKKQPPTPEEQLEDFLIRLHQHQGFVIQEMTGLEANVADLLKRREELVNLGVMTMEILMISEQVLRPAATNE